MYYINCYYTSSGFDPETLDETTTRNEADNLASEYWLAFGVNDCAIRVELEPLAGWEG